MKKSIKAKILSSIIIVLLFLMVIGYFITFYYFKFILIRQSIEDDKAVLKQHTIQIEYIIRDIKKFAEVLLIDRDIQNFVKEDYSTGNYDEILKTKKIMDKVKEYCVVKDYIQSVGIVTSNNQVYWQGLSFASYLLEEEFDDELLSGSIGEGFSKPHIINMALKPSEIISYKVRIRDIEHPDRTIGYLVLNIFYDYLLKPVFTTNQIFNGLIWQDQDGNIFFNSTPLLTQENALSDSFGQGEGYRNISNVTNRREGYYITSDSLTNGWKYISFTSIERINSFKWKSLIFFMVFIALCGGIFIFIIIIPVLHNIVKPITILSESMHKVSSGDMEISIDITSGDELEVLADSFNKMMKELKNYLHQSLASEKQKQRLEFELILAQINPHFIYNTLNSIVYMARKHKNPDIVEMTTSFIKILQDIFTISDDNMFATVRQEIEILKQYITVQQYRYKDVFEISYYIDEQCEGQIIPKGIMLPLVENSIYHGIHPKMVMGHIEVIILRQDNDLVITVKDNGVGFDKQRLERFLNNEEEFEAKGSLRSIGIASIKKRISFLYGSRYGLEIKSKENAGSCFTIRLPFANS